MKYYIGLDAHSTTSTFAVVDEQGQCVLRETVKTSEQSLGHVINRIHGERHMTFEESSISQWLFLQLKDKVDKLLICNPTYVAKKQGAKTDFRDALHLAQELRTNHLQPVFHDTSHWMEIRTTVSGYLDIVEEIVRFKNRLKAIFRAEAIQTDENSFYKNKATVSKLTSTSAKFVAEKLFDQIEYLEAEKAKYKEVFESNRKKYRPIRNLMTIPVSASSGPILLRRLFVSRRVLKTSTGSRATACSYGIFRSLPARSTAINVSSVDGS
jgi:hypothetical protein